MVAYRTCTGCVLQGKPCDMRDAMRERVRGLGITSIKWKCIGRVPRFKVGDLAWAKTTTGDGDDSLTDLFPATVIRVLGAKALVFIDGDALSRGNEAPFEARGNGFCKMPLSRLEPRDGEPETICPACEWPSFKGHQDGRSCHYAQQHPITGAPDV